MPKPMPCIPVCQTVRTGTTGEGLALCISRKESRSKWGVRSRFVAWRCASLDWRDALYLSAPCVQDVSPGEKNVGADCGKGRPRLDIPDGKATVIAMAVSVIAPRRGLYV